jgi:hypothetical protein
MRKGRILFSLFLIALGGFAAYSAREWTFKAALFPLTVSIPLMALAAAQLLSDLFGSAETAGGGAVDMEFAADVAPEVARQRTLGIFLWIAGFILLVSLVGFPIAVPVFMLSYLSIQSRAGLAQTVILTACAWGFFYGLFQRLLHLPFEEGWIQTLLGI